MFDRSYFVYTTLELRNVIDRYCYAPIDKQCVSRNRNT